jgi:hypothetical protein
MSDVVPGRGPEDEQTWEKAKRDLAEGEALDLTHTPSLALHKSHYAKHVARQSRNAELARMQQRARRCDWAFSVYRDK